LISLSWFERLGGLAVGFAAGDDRLQEQVLGVFHVGNKVDISLQANNQYTLP
jgi:hypothetical protein